MKLISFLCLSLSLAVPTAASLDNVKICTAKSDVTGIGDGTTQVRVFCTGKAEDFGGNIGDEVDCFNSTETTLNSIRKEDCKNITVQIKYKMGNAMSKANKKKDREPDMFLQFVKFGQGSFNADNEGITGDFTEVNNSAAGSSANKPRKGDLYGARRFSTFRYNATVNQCDDVSSNQFFMKMKLKPYRIFADGSRGTSSKDDGEPGQIDFVTAKCGINGKVEFAQRSNPEPIPVTPAPIPATPAPTPKATPTATPTARSQEPTPAPQAKPNIATSAPSAPSAKGKGKGTKSSGKRKVRKTIRGN